MNYTKHVEWFFFALLSGTAGISVKYLGDLSTSITSMSQSMAELSGKIEILTTKLSFTEQRIYDHEGRLRHIEAVRK
jgi:hypothetical protein